MWVGREDCADIFCALERGDRLDISKENNGKVLNTREDS
jgi:hypothetical protein